MRICDMPNTATRPERDTCACLHRLGHHPLWHVAGLPGTPDLVLPDRRVAVQAMGCFWHHHAGCRLSRIPPTAFPWARKFAGNRARDLRQRDALLRRGWRVLWVWECTFRGEHALTATALDRLVAGFLGSRQPTFGEIAAGTA